MKIFMMFWALLALAACKDTTSPLNLNDKADLLGISVEGVEPSLEKDASAENTDTLALAYSKDPADLHLAIEVSPGATHKGLKLEKLSLRFI